PVKICVDLAREREQARAQAVVRRRVGAGEQDRVVLVGGEGLLASSLAAERKPAPVDAREIVPRERELARERKPSPSGAPGIGARGAGPRSPAATARRRARRSCA